MNDLLVLYSLVAVKVLVLIHYSSHCDDFSLVLPKIKKVKTKRIRKCSKGQCSDTESKELTTDGWRKSLNALDHYWITSYWEWFSKSNHPERWGFGRGGAVIEAQCCNKTSGSNEEKSVSTIALMKLLLQLLHVSARNYEDLGNITKISENV